MLFVAEKSPRLRRGLWRWWYNKLAKEMAAAEWTFMNYGCQSNGGECEVNLEGADEADRFCIQLYERVISGVEMNGANALEVGSGRGGGASYIARYRKPRSLVGVDFSSEAV